MKNLYLTLILLMPALFCLAQSGEKNFIDQNYIEVTGKAEMEVVPDEIYLNIVISEKDNNGKSSVEQLERSMLGYMKQLEIDVEKDLSVRDVASNFKSYWLKGKVARTTKGYVLRLHGTEKMGKLIQKLEEMGISNIDVDRVDHSDMDKYRQEVRVKAAKAAKEKAEALAGALGQSIGKALYVYEPGGAYYKTYAPNIMVRGAAAMDSATPEQEPEFEKMKLESSVTVRFELK